jgi:four helix bundle protein
MRKSSISISSNIAEGTGRHGKKDKARFTEIAYGSSLELLNQVIISHELSFLHKNQHEAIRNSIEEITKMLDGLHKSQLN